MPTRPSDGGGSCASSDHRACRPACASAIAEHAEVTKNTETRSSGRAQETARYGVRPAAGAAGRVQTTQEVAAENPSHRDPGLVFPTALASSDAPLRGAVARTGLLRVVSGPSCLRVCLWPPSPPGLADRDRLPLPPGRREIPRRPPAGHRPGEGGGRSGRPGHPRRRERRRSGAGAAGRAVVAGGPHVHRRPPPHRP